MGNFIKKAEALIVEQMEAKIVGIKQTLQKVKASLVTGNYEEMNAQLRGLAYLCDNAVKRGEGLCNLSYLEEAFDLLSEQLGLPHSNSSEKEGLASKQHDLNKS